MPTYNVSNTTELMAAAAKAVAGDTILLAAGSYAKVNLSNINPAGNITIASADSSNPAVLLDLNMYGSSNITLSDLTFTTADDSVYYHFTINNSNNITVINSLFDGPGMTPTVDTTGLFVRSSTNVTVTNSEFTGLVRGITHLDAIGFTVENSYFHDMRSDGVSGGGSSHVTIANNFFTNFYPNATDHPDAIQFWTRNETTVATDITITGNVMVRGDKGYQFQGVFIRDDYGTLHFTDVDVTDNIVLGGLYNGIYFDGVDSGTATGNYVAGFADMTSWIRTLNDGAALNLWSNKATQYVTQIDETADNSLVTAITDGGLAALQAWAQTHAAPGGLASWDQALAYAGLIAPPTNTGGTSTGGTSAGGTSTGGTTTGGVQSPTGGTTTLVPIGNITPSGLVLDVSTNSGATNDALTNYAQVRINGTASAGANVTLYDGGAIVGSAFADANGWFSIQTNGRLADGVHSLTATSVNSAGIVSALSTALEVTVDTQAAFAVVNQGKLVSSSLGTSVALSGEATDTAGGVAFGVNIFQDGTLIGSASPVDGKWSYTASNVTNSVHSYTTQTVDAAGNVGVGTQKLILGTSGRDSNIRGDSMNAVIIGGGGFDVLTGGSGHNTFVYNSASDAGYSARKNAAYETITNWHDGMDRIDLTGLGNLDWAGQTSATSAKSLNWYYSNGDTYIAADVNGDTRPDFILKMMGLQSIDTSDFVMV